MKIRAPFKIQIVYAANRITPVAFHVVGQIDVSDRTAIKIMCREGWEQRHARNGFCWTFPAFGFYLHERSDRCRDAAN